MAASRFLPACAFRVAYLLTYLIAIYPTSNAHFNPHHPQLVTSPDLSEYFCTNCSIKLSSYFQYKQELIEKQEKLLSFLSNKESSLSSDTDSVPDIRNEESFQELEVEVLEVTKDPQPTCQHCQLTFSDQNQLQIHQKQHKSCDFCDFTATTKSALLKHIKTSHSANKDPRVCPDCGKILKGNNHLNFHIKTKHLKLTKFQCDLCDFRSYGKYELRSHIVIHHLPIEYRKEFKCDECPSILTTAMSLKTHKIHKHSGLRPHECFFCHKNFALKETLKSHIRNVHNGERRFKCPHCGKGFNSNPRLNDHVNNFHGQKQEIPCGKCGKIFNSARNLQTHLVYHSAPTLKCNDCDKMFYIKKNLREHKESVHWGVTYQCDVCQRSFQSTSGLRRHAKTHGKLAKEGAVKEGL